MILKKIQRTLNDGIPLTALGSLAPKRFFFSFILFLYPMHPIEANQGVSPEIFLQLGHSGGINCVCFNPDGKTLASGSNDKTIKLWDAATGKLVATLAGHTDVVNSVSFSADGKLLASGSWDKTVKLWDVSTGKLVMTLGCHAYEVLSVCFSPDGRLLASGSWDRTVKLWDVASGKLFTTLAGHEKAVNAVCFSPNGSMLASGSEDKTVKLWDVLTGRLVATLAGHSNMVNSVSFSRDAKILASGSVDRTVKLWDVASEKLITTLAGHENKINSVGFSPDSKILASGSEDRTVKLWDVSTGKLVATLAGHEGEVTSVNFSADKLFLASGSLDNTVRLWNAATGKLIATLAGQTNIITSLSFSPDGSSLAFGSNDRTVKIWDLSTGRLVATLAGHENKINSVSFSPDARILASGSEDNTVRLWDVSTGKLVATLAGHESGVTSVSFSPHGKILASGSNDKTIKLWDVSFGKLMATLVGHGKRVTSVSFSPHGGFLASGSEDSTVRLWDVAAGKLLVTLTTHECAVTSVGFSPDEKFLASGCLNAGVKLWDVAAGKLFTTLTGHTKDVHAVSFSPDGKFLASGSDDNTVKLWDVVGGKPVATFAGYEKGVHSVIFSPDGKFIAAGGNDHAVKLWDASTGKIVSVIALLPGTEWIVFGPRDSGYISSLQGDEYAAIRFDGSMSIKDIYPLSHFKRQLKRDSIAIDTGNPTELHLKLSYIDRLTHWWTLVPVKDNWAIFIVLFSAIIALLIILRIIRRSEPLFIAKKFFFAAGCNRIESRGKSMMTVEWTKEKRSGIVVLWQYHDGKNPIGLQLEIDNLSEECDFRPGIYLVYREIGPDITDAKNLREKTGLEVIPLQTILMEKAMSEKSSTAWLREIEEPYTTRTDPYAESRPIDDPVWFFGRKSHLERIPSLLSQGQHVGIFGLRKIGKTSLINQLTRHFLTTPTAFIDCQKMSADASDYFFEIVKQFAEHLEAMRVECRVNADVRSVEGFREAMLYMHENYTKKEITGRFLLIFDEIDKMLPAAKTPENEKILIEYVKLFRVLRGLAQNNACCTMLVVAYRPDVNRRNLLTETSGENPMYMSFKEEYLGFLDKHDTSSLIRQIGAWKEIRWDDGAAEEVFDYCGGHPLLTRFFCSEACAQGATKHITLALVSGIKDELARTLRRNAIGNYFNEAMWALLREEEKQLLAQVNKTETLPEESVATSFDEALTNLVNFGLLTLTGGALTVAGTLLKNWLDRRPEPLSGKATSPSGKGSDHEQSL